VVGFITKFCAVSAKRKSAAVVKGKNYTAFVPHGSEPDKSLCKFGILDGMKENVALIVGWLGIPLGNTCLERQLGWLHPWSRIRGNERSMHIAVFSYGVSA
jgi:hypothetical protein